MSCFWGHSAAPVAGLHLGFYLPHCVCIGWVSSPPRPSPMSRNLDLQFQGLRPPGARRPGRVDRLARARPAEGPARGAQARRAPVTHAGRMAAAIPPLHAQPRRRRPPDSRHRAQPSWPAGPSGRSGGEKRQAWTAPVRTRRLGASELRTRPPPGTEAGRETVSLPRQGKNGFRPGRGRGRDGTVLCS